ncbi:hypothetical protein AXF42_Ash009617 [Apostasia shenzhenica]|uniref:ARM repeat superfamily protein n=1 Tax=Apostasia shenzhenica TaxID=1088818 RepID=A0A2I0B9B1_9ASPA|nr:hypothetical protein AXF42_Ash009617 [Apostasia shenzhenica]
MHRLSRLRSLAHLRRLRELSVGFQSHGDGHLLRKISPPQGRHPPTSPSPAYEAESFYFRPLPASFPSSTFFRSFKALGAGIDMGTFYFRRFSSHTEKDDIALEEEVERKVGWLLKLFFVVTAVAVGYQFFPYMGDNLLQQSISLLHVKDPLFKRMGASRLRRFAIDGLSTTVMGTLGDRIVQKEFNDRRMRVIEMGGAQDLLNMLEGAKDDKTRKEALRTLLALSHCDEAAKVLHQVGAAAIVASTPDSSEFAEVEKFKSSLLKRLSVFEPDQTPSEVALS